MAYLKKIIEQVEKDFKVHVHGSFNPEQQIESVQFLISGNKDNYEFSPSILYIANDQDYQYTLDAPVLYINCYNALSNETGLYIHQKLNLLELSNCIQKEILRFHQVKLKREEMFHVLHAGYGIQSIINTARTYLNNPITICSTSFSVIACSPVDDYNNNFEIHNNKRYLKKSSIENMNHKMVMDHLFKEHTPLIMHFEEDPHTEYLFCSIYIRRTVVGYICIRGDIRPFTEEDLDFVMDTSYMLAIEMQKEESFTLKSGLKYEYFLTDLLERNLDNAEFTAQRLIQLGQEFYKYFWILTFSFSDEGANHMKPNYYIDQLLNIFHNSMAFFYKGSLVLLLTSKNTSAFDDIDFRRFTNFLQLNQMYAAVSFRYENLMDTYIYYDQAMFLLKEKKTSPPDRIYHYSDYYLYHLFHQSRLPMKSFIHPDINSLIQYDAMHNTNYLATLRCYLEHNRNALRAANHLHIHKSTFFYRIGKISELIHMQIDDCKILSAYELSFAIIDYMRDHSL